MATIAPERVLASGQVTIWKWVNLTENDDCLPVSLPDKADKSFMVTGTFGVAGEIGLLGTVDPDQDDYVPNRAFHTGNEIAITGNARVAVIENDLYSCPYLRAGTGVEVTCWLMARESS